MRIKGFTLIELIVVIAIIAILAAIVAPNAFKAVEKAKVSGAIEDFRSIKTGAMAFYADLGTWPGNCTGPAATGCAVGFITDPGAPNNVGWDGPYIEKWPQQAKWGGNVSFNASLSDTKFGLAGPERYVTFPQVPQQAAKNLDKSIDGTNNTTSGGVQYTDAATVAQLYILVSRDGAVD